MMCGFVRMCVMACAVLFFQTIYVTSVYSQEVVLYPRTRSLSQQAIEKAQPIMDKIKEHPFIQGLQKQDLPLEKFAFYIAQDFIYLQEAGRLMAMAAGRVPFEYREMFFNLAFQRFQRTHGKSPQDIYNHYVEGPFQNKGGQTVALHAYLDFLSSVVMGEAPEVIIAAFLPCPLSYHYVAVYLSQGQKAKGLYAKWINKYAAAQYRRSVQEACDVFDAMAQNASDAVRQRMVETFIKSLCLEYHFWNDAYQGRLLMTP